MQLYAADERQTTPIAVHGVLLFGLIAFSSYSIDWFIKTLLVPRHIKSTFLFYLFKQMYHRALK